MLSANVHRSSFGVIARKRLDRTAAAMQVGIALGTPVMSAVLAALAVGPLLPGLRVSIAVNAALALLTATAVGLFLRLPAAGSGVGES
jgi:CBS domain containing-hemolysin-like protein